MKKLVLIVLIAILFVGCGKKEKGIVTIENKSSYPIEFEFAQNYESKMITLQPNNSIDCAWERYFHFIINKPSINILKKQETKEKIVILNNDNLYSYTVQNGVCNLTMLDNNQFLLALPTNSPTDSITLNKGQSNIKTFRSLSVQNVIFDKNITIGTDQYLQFKRDGNLFYYKKTSGDYSIAIIKVEISGNNIIIFKING